ncbi:MAG: dTMP kinase [Candidatus Latescibacterota bacterium]
MRRPLFLVFEGIDGSGTTTQAELLSRHIQSLGLPVVCTREPGGTPLAEKIRDLLLDPEQTLCPTTEMLLYAAARAQHVTQTITPALRAGHPVISDRYVASSLAYQGVGRGLGVEAVWEANRLAVAGALPDLTIFLDLPLGLARQRREARARTPDRMELVGDALQERAAQGYRLLAARDAAAWVLLDAARPQDVVAEEINRLVHKRWPAFPYGE